MEFPSLGQHCHQKDCQQLDFLPMKCDACSNIFCKDHIQYSTHVCPESWKKDNQVPVCPLCNKPIPLKKDEVPDMVVGRHIDSDCQSDPARERRKVYTNKCSYKHCKQKEMIPVRCEKCQKNYCLRHRFENDHACQGFEGTGQSTSRQGAAAAARQSNNTKPKPTNPKPQQTQLSSSLGKQLKQERESRQLNQGRQGASQPNQGRQLSQQQARDAQAGLSEEEAMARAIQMSLAETQQAGPSGAPAPSLSQEEEDTLLAQALAASEEEARRQINRRQQQQRQQHSEKKSCQVS